MRAPELFRFVERGILKSSKIPQIPMDGLEGCCRATGRTSKTGRTFVLIGLGGVAAEERG